MFGVRAGRVNVTVNNSTECLRCANRIYRTRTEHAADVESVIGWRAKQNVAQKHRKFHLNSIFNGRATATAVSTERNDFGRHIRSDPHMFQLNNQYEYFMRLVV